MKNITEMIETLKKQKILVLFFVLFVIVILAIIFSGSTKFNLTPQTPTKVPYSTKKGTVEFIRSLPENGVRSTFDSFEVLTFEFSDEINIETVDVIASPYIELRVTQNPEFPNIVAVLPAKKGWEPGVKYTVTIRSLESVSGEKLKDNVTYTYINNPPNDDVELPF